MADKNFGLALTTAEQTAYTCPTGFSARITMIQVANKDGTNSVDATVKWVDVSAGSPLEEFHFCFTAPVAADDVIGPMGGGFILEAGDYIVAYASANGDADLSGAVIEAAV